MDTKFKTKYICDIELSREERKLDLEEIVKIIKEKVENSSILQEYNREYKRIHRAHYSHTKEFKEKKFKECSEKFCTLYS